MSQYRFRILCADTGKSCTLVKDAMRNDFDQVYNITNSDNFDHEGIGDFDSDKEAREMMEELKRKTNGLIIDHVISKIK